MIALGWPPILAWLSDDPFYATLELLAGFGIACLYLVAIVVLVKPERRRP
jgi:hypothetical protein